MAKRRDVKSVMVELNRLGAQGGTLQQGTEYIRTTGYDEPALPIKVGLSYTDFTTSAYALRYQGADAAKVEAALQKFESEACHMLPDVAPDPDQTVQLDLVCGAAELWAFPFEAYARGKHGIVVTRRIRGNFGEHAQWPAVPKILFAHAAIDQDLEKDLIDEHIAALRNALRPWAGGGDPIGKVLFVEEIYSVENLQKARSRDFTHIHLLGHGTLVEGLAGPPLKDWGMRLGKMGAPGVHPSRIAAALSPVNGRPVAVTIASCDSGNQADSASASYSLAQELHRGGVPVVVASQLPLTKHGSVLVTKHFYEPLLRGEDVRNALNDVREALQNDAQAGHDWVSVVAYVRLPENYEEHLGKVALSMELAMLRAAQKRADQVIKANDHGALNDVELLIRDRIASLDARLRELKEKKDDKDRLECQGLLASAYKRLAELLFLAGRNPADQRLALDDSLKNYSAAFASDLNAHWQGVQQLALQAVLHGEINAADYDIVMRVAERDAANETEYWAQGTIAELALLATVAKKADAMDGARDAVNKFLQRAAGKDDDIDSTRRQLRRYVDWWTPANGFATDLAKQATELAALLD